MKEPKYSLGEKVNFDICGTSYSGEIYIIDAHGTFERPGEVSYDILGEYEGRSCLFKHIPETDVTKA